MEPGPPRLYTVGHSTRTLDELVALLEEHGVTQLVDVRHFPRSRRNPQFNQEALNADLPKRGIAYEWMGDTLGGVRSGGYEAYMETPQFGAGIERLKMLVRAPGRPRSCAPRSSGFAAIGASSPAAWPRSATPLPTSSLRENADMTNPCRLIARQIEFSSHVEEGDPGGWRSGAYAFG